MPSVSIVVVKYHGYLNITYSYIFHIFDPDLCCCIGLIICVILTSVCIWPRFVNMGQIHKSGSFAQEVCMFKMGMALLGHRVDVVTS